MCLGRCDQTMISAARRTLLQAKEETKQLAVFLKPAMGNACACSKVQHSVAVYRRRSRNNTMTQGQLYGPCIMRALMIRWHSISPALMSSGNRQDEEVESLDYHCAEVARHISGSSTLWYAGGLISKASSNSQVECWSIAHTGRVFQSRPRASMQ